MKRQIILTIEPHEDGVRCGECERRNAPASMEFYCNAWRWDGVQAIRGPLCPAAEAKWRAVEKAGNVMGNLCGPHTNAAQAWISAVEEAGK